MNFADAVTAASALGAALSFTWGVSAWRREFVGRRRIELAEEVLTKFYEMEDVIRAIRSPLSSSTEGSSRKRGEAETAEETQILDQAYVVFERMQSRKEFLASFRALRYRYMASFGRNAGKAFDDVDEALRRIRVAGRMLAHLWRDHGRRHLAGADLEQQLKRLKKHEAVFWESEDDSDEIRALVDSATAQVERISERVTRTEVHWLRGTWHRTRIKTKKTWCLLRRFAPSSTTDQRSPSEGRE